MKKFFVIAAALVCGLSVLASCEKSDTKEYIDDVTLSSGAVSFVINTDCANGAVYAVYSLEDIQSYVEFDSDDYTGVLSDQDIKSAFYTAGFSGGVLGILYIPLANGTTTGGETISVSGLEAGTTYYIGAADLSAEGLDGNPTWPSNSTDGTGTEGYDAITYYSFIAE